MNHASVLLHEQFSVATLQNGTRCQNRDQCTLNPFSLNCFFSRAVEGPATGL
jgi:hypothetical protein